MATQLVRLAQGTVFVLIGAGLALSLFLLNGTAIVLVSRVAAIPLWALVAISAVIVVVPIVVVGLIPVVRTIEGAATQTLLHAPLPEGIPEPARSWPQRWRSLAWFVLHLACGGIVTAVVMGAIAFPGWWSLVLTVAAVACLVGFTALLRGAAPTLLGLSPAERLQRLQQEAGRAVERNRIAREIHDSLGHSLSVMTLQAAAARKVIDNDPDFAVSALEAIEQASRSAAVDLDHALGLLRDGASSTGSAPSPDLSDLAALLTATRQAGLDVSAEVTADVTDVPLLISREAYRVVQEALTNALRYSSDHTATLNISLHDDELSIVVVNPAAQANGPDRGRGLAGMQERAQTLAGQFHAGHDGSGSWQLTAAFPTTPAGAR